MSCQEVTRAISDDDGRVLRRRDIRAHLRRCDSCQAFRAEISERRGEFASLAPLPAAASAAILQGLLGGAGGGTSAVGGAAGAVAGKAVVGSAAIKSAAAVLAISTVGVVAADRSGVINLGVGSHPTPPAKSIPAATQPGGQPSAGKGPAAAVGTIRSAAPKARRGRRDLGKASAVGTAVHRPAPSSPGPAAEQLPQPHGRHLGGGHEGSTGKPSHPVKGAKGASATSPGHSKSPGKAKHTAGGKAHGGKPAAESHPPHPEHPAGSAKSQTPAAPASEAESAAAEPASGKPGKPAAE